MNGDGSGGGTGSGGGDSSSCLFCVSPRSSSSQHDPEQPLPAVNGRSPVHRRRGGSEPGAVVRSRRGAGHSSAASTTRAAFGLPRAEEEDGTENIPARGDPPGWAVRGGFGSARARSAAGGCRAAPGPAGLRVAVEHPARVCPCPTSFPPKTKPCWGCGKLSCSLCKGWGHLSAEPVFCGQQDPTVGWDVLF